MHYRRFGKTGLDVSLFGLGCMRFPEDDDGKGKKRVIRDTAIDIIRTAADRGVNYFDTAYSYHDGESERILGEAFSEEERRKILIATKCPVWKIEKGEDFDRFLNEQLEKMKTPYVDFYLLHTLNRSFWENVYKHGALGFLDRIKKDGRARYVGFSFHDSYEVFREILESYTWDMTQIQLNYLDQDYQAGVKGLKLAASKGVPVVIMEPLRGGKLAVSPSKEIERTWNSGHFKGNPVEWAFRWLYNFSEVNVVLSGVSSKEQLLENTRIFSEARSNCMTQEDLETIDKVKRLYDSMSPIDCTGCNYCLPCPSGVEIPTLFGFYNDAVLYNEKASKAEVYKRFVSAEKGAEACVECGNCEEACPQNLRIIRHLKEVHSYFSEA